jgi:hypothetical protein
MSESLAESRRVLDRRNFLKTASATGAGIALSPLSAITLEDNWYTNPRLDITLCKPAGWHFISLSDFNLLLDEQWTEVDEDRKLLEAICTTPPGPILVINKYRRPPEDAVCPTIQMHADPLDLDLPDVVATAFMAEFGFRRLHRDYVLESAVAPAVIGGVEGAAWSCTHIMGPGRGFRVRAWAGIARSDKAEFSIGMAGPVDGADYPETEFEAVRQSLWFV